MHLILFYLRLFHLNYLEDFCTGFAQAQTRDEMILGKPWTDNNRTYFRSADFQKFLQARLLREAPLEKPSRGR